MGRERGRFLPLANAQRLSDEEFGVDARSGEPISAVVRNGTIIAYDEILGRVQATFVPVAETRGVTDAIRAGISARH